MVSKRLSQPNAHGALPAWLAGGVVCFLACAITTHFLIVQWRAWVEQGIPPLFAIARHVFSLYRIAEQNVSGALVTGLGLAATAAAVGLLILVRLLLDREAALWLRGALFAVAFAGGALAMPLLGALGLMDIPEFTLARILIALAWMTGALAVGFAVTRYHHGLAPDWVVFALAFLAGLAALGIIEPHRWDPVLFTTIGWLGLCLLCGYLLMACWDFFLPSRARFAIAFTLGLTLGGLLTELLTMAHLLSRWPLMVAGATLAGALALAAHLRRSRPFHESGQPVSTRQRAVATRQAVERYEGGILRARGLQAWLVYYPALAATALITALTFYHGVGYFETNWDSLILYLGYARMTYLEQGFPFKAVAQVGIGLGANYPHLFSTFAATGPALAGQWSPLGGQLAAPLAGAVACLPAYHLALRLTRSESLAMLAVLLFRSVPMGVIYTVYASDYAFAILFTVAFLYMAVLYMETAAPAYFVAMTLLCAGATHINYLMTALWGLWTVAVILAHAGRRLSVRDARHLRRQAGEKSLLMSEVHHPHFEDEGEIVYDDVLLYAEKYPRASLRMTLMSKWFWTVTTVGLVLASTWFVRNQVLTGNPVYSFFPDRFGGVRINPQVLESAEIEWMRNGAGMARIADYLGIPYGELTVGQKILYAPWYFYFFKGWRTQPFLFAWAAPGMILLLLGLGRRVLSRQARPSGGASEIDLSPGAGEKPEEPAAPLRLALRLSNMDRAGILALVTVGGFLTYHIALADFYLYQIVPALAALPVFFVRSLESACMRPWRQIMVVCVFVAVVTSGIPSALMGFKLLDTELIALRNPGMSPNEVIALRFPDDANWGMGPQPQTMFDDINRMCPGQRVLTHENRHLLFDPSITLVHLDDWEMQQLWGAPPDRVLEGLQRAGIGWYLYVPNEDNHAVNEALGMERLISAGLLRFVESWGNDLRTGARGRNRLYAIPPGPAGAASGS